MIAVVLFTVGSIDEVAGAEIELQDLAERRSQKCPEFQGISGIKINTF